jgi:hypothetical protein
LIGPRVLINSIRQQRMLKLIAIADNKQVGQLDISDDRDKAAILQGDRKADEERIHFIRKPVEIKVRTKSSKRTTTRDCWPRANRVL